MLLWENKQWHGGVMPEVDYIPIAIQPLLKVKCFISVIPEQFSQCYRVLDLCLDMLPL